MRRMLMFSLMLPLTAFFSGAFAEMPQLSQALATAWNAPAMNSSGGEIDAAIGQLIAQIGSGMRGFSSSQAKTCFVKIISDGGMPSISIVTGSPMSPERQVARLALVSKRLTGAKQINGGLVLENMIVTGGDQKRVRMLFGTTFEGANRNIKNVELGFYLIGNGGASVQHCQRMVPLN